jgi:tetratricopeptide (TPR) repeat protein
VGRFVSALTVLLFLAPGVAPAQSLGTIAFPTSGSAAAQPAFVRGVLFLHSFEYDSAAREFREAQRLDPGFAMAYWGEAMTSTHPVWNQQDLAAARAALARLAPTRDARRARAPTPREQGYLEAVEILYGEGTKPQRDTLYAEAMARLLAANPGDDEARTFYALALIGLSQGVRVVPTYVKAGAIADSVFGRNPDHPGAAHYVIHAYDDPAHAAQGLAAARAYSKIAPGAPHAQHMTTHIFLALGLWDDVIAQNVVASGHDHDRYRAGHYTSWLLYGLVQAGRWDEASQLLTTVHANYKGAPEETAYLVSMRAYYLIGASRWSDPVRAWAIPPTGGPVARGIDAFTQGYAALQRGARGEAERWLGELRTGAKPRGATTLGPVPTVLEKILAAGLALEQRRTEEAQALLEDAARIEAGLPVEFGPPDLVVLPQEALGDFFLELKKPAQAQWAFDKALAQAPNRARALAGAARAAEAAGDGDAARKACQQLTAIWHAADKAALDQLKQVCH